MFEVVSLILGPAVVAGVVTQVFNMFLPGRVSERVNAFKDELEALRSTDDGSSLGKAAYAVSRADVVTAMINRLSPSGGPQSLGLLILSMCSFVFVAFISSIAHANGLFEHLLLWFGLAIYSIFAVFSFVMGVLIIVTSAKVHVMLSIGFRKADDMPSDELRDAFDGLRAVLRPVAPGEHEQYRLRPLYQITLSQPARTRLRSFLRELDRSVAG